ncbi:MAG: hypothetical protein PVI21_01125 [Candidatus Woesebacteria bacterium]|jgi:hypothetical protein
MRLLDLNRYLNTPEGSYARLEDEGLFEVTLAEAASRLIQVYAESDDNEAFGDFKYGCMGVASASKTVLAHCKPEGREDEGRLLKKLAQTLMRFQWWSDSLNSGEPLDSLGIAYPTTTRAFTPEVPEQLPDTNLQRALLAISWALGRQMTVNLDELAKHDRIEVAAALGLAVEIELVNGLPFEGALMSLLIK